MLFFKDKWVYNSPSMIQGFQEALRHPQRPRQAQPGQVQQVPVMFINVKWSQGDHDAHGYPQRPRQAKPRRVQQVPVMLIKN